MPVQRWKPACPGVFGVAVARQSPWASIQALLPSSMMQPQVPWYQTDLSERSSFRSHFRPCGVSFPPQSRYCQPSSSPAASEHCGQGTK